ncbi:glycosyltransferase family 2 protein [Novosphingobium gossypii]|uniref:glycosyltransferase family 2 protein n=1 Tax=Novosphingobium gossypii TaxID=1604774 RepID=UPI003D196036
MVARNTAPFIDAAIRSARAQTMCDVEIVVVDDGSTDGTKEIINNHARVDARVRLLDGPGRGLSAVRNTSLDAARGRFAVILDSDDMLHPSHIDGLFDNQTRSGGVICASNMVEFSIDGSSIAGKSFVTDSACNGPRSVSVEDFLKAGMIGAKHLSLGYLKPMFDLQFLQSKGIRYDERLRIGEDFDLVLRAMLEGADYQFLPQTTYYYRRHPGSTSHRLSTADVSGLIEATRGYPVESGSLHGLLVERMNNLEGSRRQLEALAALRQRRLLAAWALSMPHRHARKLFLASLAESIMKRLGIHKGEWATQGRSEALGQHFEIIAEFLHPMVTTP